MKRLFAIGLLAAFLFNLGGFYVFFWVLKVQANKELSKKLDNEEYNDKETIEIKVPISLPYPLQSSGFQRQSGQFVYNQKHYQLVKQKYENDTLTIVAIKDVKVNQISGAMKTFAEGTSQHPVKEGTINFSVKILFEYLNVGKTEINMGNSWSQLIFAPQYSKSSLNPFRAILSPPPKVS